MVVLKGTTWVTRDKTVPLGPSSIRSVELEVLSTDQPDGTVTATTWFDSVLPFPDGTVVPVPPEVVAGILLVVAGTLLVVAGTLLVVAGTLLVVTVVPGKAVVVAGSVEACVVGVNGPPPAVVAGAVACVVVWCRPPTVVPGKELLVARVLEVTGKVLGGTVVVPLPPEVVVVTVSFGAGLWLVKLGTIKPTAAASTTKAAMPAANFTGLKRRWGPPEARARVEGHRDLLGLPGKWGHRDLLGKWGHLGRPGLPAHPLPRHHPSRQVALAGLRAGRHPPERKVPLVPVAAGAPAQAVPVEGPPVPVEGPPVPVEGPPVPVEDLSRRCRWRDRRCRYRLCWCRGRDGRRSGRRNGSATVFTKLRPFGDFCAAGAGSC